MGIGTTDEFFIDAPPAVVQRMLLGLAADATWWPGAWAGGGPERVRVRAPVGGLRGRARFEADVENVRRAEGFTWMLTGGDLHGRAEWWLEAYRRGTIVHYYLDVTRGNRGRHRRASSLVRRHRWAVRRGVNALKDLLEARVGA